MNSFLFFLPPSPLSLLTPSLLSLPPASPSLVPASSAANILPGDGGGGHARGRAAARDAPGPAGGGGAGAAGRRGGAEPRRAMPAAEGPWRRSRGWLRREGGHADGARPAAAGGRAREAEARARAGSPVAARGRWRRGEAAGPRLSDSPTPPRPSSLPLPWRRAAARGRRRT